MCLQQYYYKKSTKYKNASSHYYIHKFFFHLVQLYFAVNETQHFLFMFNNTVEGSLVPEGAF